MYNTVEQAPPPIGKAILIIIAFLTLLKIIGTPITWLWVFSPIWIPFAFLAVGVIISLIISFIVLTMVIFYAIMVSIIVTIGGNR